MDKNPHVIELLTRSVKENGLERQVTPLLGNILAYRGYLKPDTMDLVYMNPPYRIGGRQRQLMTEACHEVGVTLEDFIKAAAFALKTRGRLAMVQLPDRFTDALRLADQYHLEIKRLQWVHSYADRGAWIFLAEFQKGGRGGLTVLPPLVMYQKDGSLSQDALAYYEGKECVHG